MDWVVGRGLEVETGPQLWPWWASIVSSDLVFYLWWADLCLCSWVTTLIAGAGLCHYSTVTPDSGHRLRPEQRLTRDQDQRPSLLRPARHSDNPAQATALYISEYKGAATVKFTSSEHNYIFAILNRIYSSKDTINESNQQVFGLDFSNNWYLRHPGSGLLYKALSGASCAWGEVGPHRGQWGLGGITSIATHCDTLIQAPAPAMHSRSHPFQLVIVVR